MVIPRRFNPGNHLLYTNRRAPFLHPSADLDRLAPQYIHSFNITPFRITAVYEEQVSNSQSGRESDGKDKDGPDITPETFCCFPVDASMPRWTVSRQ